MRLVALCMVPFEDGYLDRACLKSYNKPSLAAIHGQE